MESHCVGGGGGFSCLWLRCVYYYSMPSSAVLMGALGLVLSCWAGRGTDVQQSVCQSVVITN